MVRRKVLAIFLGLLGVIIISSNSYANLKETLEDSTTNYLSQQFLNASFIIADSDAILVMGARGLASLDGTQLKANQQMPLGSISETIIAAAILRLQEQGLLKISEKISKYLSKDSNIWLNNKAPAWISKITIHNLLTHTSTLPDYSATLIDYNMSSNEIIASIMNFISHAPMQAKFKGQYQPSNTNFLLLSMIIEQVTGKELKEYLDQEFFKPLKMNSTYMASLEEYVKHSQDSLVSNYPLKYLVALDENKKPRLEYINAAQAPMPYMKGTLISNTHDLLLWDRALHQEKILSPSSYKTMTHKHLAIKNSVKPQNYAAYGVIVSTLDDGSSIFHSESNLPGIRNSITYLPNKKLHLVILSNVSEKTIDSTDESPHSSDITNFRKSILNNIMTTHIAN